MSANTAAQAVTPLPEPGEVLGGRFEIMASLGEGGMGHVYRAFDRERGVEVALKLIVPRYLGRTERESRFLRELELGLRVEEHPHLVQMLEGGRLSDSGWPFIVMALSRGQALSHRLALGPLPPQVAAVVARQVAGAVRALHRKGVVHRDITPMNVLMDGNEAVLIDLSHAGDAAAPRLAIGHAGRLTRENEVPGTALYMPPEQARAEPAHLAMDVYAFGVTLAQMLVGPTLDQCSREEFLHLQREAKIKPPRVDLRIHTRVPKPLAELVDACTSSDPTTRPSMERVVEWLDGVLATMSIPADVSGPALVARAVAVAEDEGSKPPAPGHVVRHVAPPVGPPALDDRSTGDLWETAEPLGEGEPERAGGSWKVAVVVALLVVAVVLGLVAWWWSANGEPSASADREQLDGSGARVEAITPPAMGASSSAGTPQAPGPNRPETPPAGEQGPTKAESAVEPEPAAAPMPEPQADPKPRRKPKSRSERAGSAKEEPRAPAPAVTETRRPPETEDCIAHRAQTEQAVTDANWTTVAKLARRRECWSNQAERKRFRVRALFETQSWEACVSEGQGVTEPQIKQWVDLCQRHVD